MSMSLFAYAQKSMVPGHWVSPSNNKLIIYCMFFSTITKYMNQLSSFMKIYIKKWWELQLLMILLWENKVFLTLPQILRCSI